jgi:hypothetical protein
MNRTHQITGFVCSIAVMLISVALTQTASAQILLHEQFSFEQFGPGVAIVDSNGVGMLGFTGTPDDSTLNAAETVTETPPAPPNNYPIVDDTHNTVVSVQGDVQRPFTSEMLSLTNFVYVDTMIQPGLLSIEPPVPDAAQFAAYFSTNGNLVVRHAIYTNGCTVVNRKWSELAHTPIASNEWARLTICLNYLDAGPTFNNNEHYYAITLNGQLLSNPLAYKTLPIGGGSDCVAPDVPEPAGADETNYWFGMADSLFGGGGPENQPNNRFFSEVEYSGLGKFDDLVVTGSGVLGTTSTTSSSSTTGGAPTAFEEFIGMWGLPPQDQDPEDDPDGDGATNEEEWNAGTNPNDPNDVFEITAIERLSGSNCVTWVYGTSTTITTPFSVWRTAVLTNPPNYAVIQTGIARDSSGQSSYYDTNQTINAPDYRVVIDPKTDP